jgi:hypothetical protein
MSGPASTETISHRTQSHNPSCRIAANRGTYPTLNLTGAAPNLVLATSGGHDD